MARRWLKGNTHTHTRYSDGDSPPETVVDWYEAHGYDFLFLTDHNILIPEDHLARLQRGSMPVWQGEEVTMAAVHVNGLGVTAPIIPPWPGKSMFEAEVTEGHSERVRWAIEQIVAQGAVPHVNHPNYLYTLSIEDLLASGDFGMVEVANGHNVVHNEGDETHPSTEVIWDALLSSGRQVWGVASDDAHHFQNWGPEWANPGRGWLQVEGESANMADVLVALREGRFYGSSGLELAAYDASASEISVELANGAGAIELIGQGGELLETVTGQRAQFKLGGSSSPYVRVRATAEGVGQLWTQPVFR
ncbi:MAG: CehA/McbA family metallohydrolase [Chloroflexota bacterium]